MSMLLAQFEKIKTEVPVISVHAVNERLHAGSLLIDIREDNEILSGVAQKSIHIPRGFLEMRLDSLLNDYPGKDILLICASGTRSLLSGFALKTLGFENVFSVTGGMTAWKAEGLPTVAPQLLTQEEKKRYSRHLRIPEVQEAGQLKLKGSHVLMIGCGGLGNPASLYLAAAGVGQLTIVDDDIVDVSNLQRQVLFSESDIGQPKVVAGKNALLRLNSNMNITTVQERVTRENVDQLVSGKTIVIDGTDNFETRYLVSDSANKFKVPLVHGSVYRFDGQVSVFYPSSHEEASCYRCLYPEAPPADLAPSCMEAGVLGVLPGVVGMLQAVEAIKVILGLGKSLVNRLLVYDALSSRMEELEIAKNKECQCAVGIR